MPQSIRVYTKTARAPEPGTMVGVRLQAGDLADLDAWIAARGEDISRPEAIRRLMRKALDQGD